MEKDDFRGSDIVTPLVELPSVLCDVVEILEGAVRVVRGQGGQWSEVRVEGENIGPQVRGTLHCAVTNIAADGIMSTVNTITPHTTPCSERLDLTICTMGQCQGITLLYRPGLLHLTWSFVQRLFGACMQKILKSICQQRFFWTISGGDNLFSR